MTASESITGAIAERVRALRIARGMSQEDLASALNDSGVAWKRAAVVNFESRAEGSRGAAPGRGAVSVGELLGLARALHVPPVRLVPELSRHSRCYACAGEPPHGFTCNVCGAIAP